MARQLSHALPLVTGLQENGTAVCQFAKVGLCVLERSFDAIIDKLCSFFKSTSAAKSDRKAIALDVILLLERLRQPLSVHL